MTATRFGALSALKATNREEDCHGNRQQADVEQ